MLEKVPFTRLKYHADFSALTKRMGFPVRHQKMYSKNPPNWTLSEDAKLKIKVQILLLEEKIDAYVKNGMPEKACAYLDLPGKLEKRKKEIERKIIIDEITEVSKPKKKYTSLDKMFEDGLFKT